GGARWRLRAVAGGGRKKAAPGGAAEVEWPGGGRSGCGGFVGGDLVGTEGDDLLAGKLVELRELLLQRHELVGDEHARGFLDVAEAGGILRDDTHELGRDAVPCELVVAGDALDVVEVVFGGDFGYGDQLDAVLLALGRVHEQVAEVTRALAFLERLAHGVDVLLVLSRIVDVEDIASVAAVEIVAAPEQRRGFA